MKILFVSHSSPLKQGGAETRAREVARHLVLRGHDVTIICGKTDADDPDSETWNGVRILYKKILPDFVTRRFPYPHYIGLAASNFFLMFHLIPIFKRGKFDFVREDISPFPPSFLISLKRLRSAKRRIGVVHMLPANRKEWIRFYGIAFGFAGYLMGRLLRNGKLKYDRIVCASEWTATELRRHVGLSNRVSYAANGVNFEEFNAPRPADTSSGCIRLLSVGRLVNTKGHRYAIEAISFMHRRFPDLKLSIVGDGPLKEDLLLLSQKLGVASSIEFLPGVAHEEMPRIYSLSRFFVMPSIWEGLPVSLIEAMASRLPVIASDISGINEIVNASSAILVRPADGQDLAEKLLWAFEHPDEVLAKVQVAYETAKRYTWESTAQNEITEITPNENDKHNLRRDRFSDDELSIR